MLRAHVRRRASLLRHTAALVALAIGALAVGGGGCGEGPLRRDCFARIWAPNDGAAVLIAADFTGWIPQDLLEDHDEAWRLARIELPPGEYGYLLVRGEEEQLDPQNPLTTWRAAGETEVSLLLVSDCSLPYVVVESATVNQDSATVVARFLASSEGPGVDPASVVAVTADGAALPVEVDPSSAEIRVAAEALSGKHTITISAADEDGAAAPDARAVVWPGRRAASWEDAVLYQVMIDRFYGDDGAALDAPATPGSRAGGTLDGVRDAIERGHFDDLGVTTLWLSPVYTTPDEARPGLDGRLYEGYHGYWSTQPSGVEPRFGGDDALRAVVSAAHQRGLSVILDVVPNHVYEAHPRYVEHGADGWFNPEGCVCGTPDCPWGENIGQCWFTDYLPDLRLERASALRDVTSEISAWVRDFDLDGVRVDAVPMMPRGATRRILRELRRQVAPREATFMLGEVFTGPGVGALGELSAHIGEPGLDSVFDFPLMWALRGALASGTGSFEEVEEILQTEEEDFAGSGVVLSRILDNHDVARFIAAATGDAANDPWLDPPAQPTEPEPYDRMEIALAVLFTLPGIPVLFQGDEIGLTGASDPDNRRVMPADASLTARQVALRDAVARLSSLRACSAALRRGDRRAVSVTGTQYVYARGDDTAAPVLVAISAAPSDSAITLDTADVGDDELVDALTLERFAADASGQLALPMPALSYRVLLRADDPCLPE